MGAPSIIVTGAGSGIGRATARHLARHRSERLVLVGRRVAALEETARLVTQDLAGSPEHAPAGPLVMPCDLEDPSAAASVLGGWLTSAAVLGLALCAGGLAPGPTTDGLDGIRASWEASWRRNVLTAV